MGFRTEEQKGVRKSREAQRSVEYRSYYDSHQDETQRCLECKKEKPLREFLPTYAMRRRCKDCHKALVARWRSSSKPAADAIKARSYQRAAQTVRAVKDRPCSSCGTHYPPYVLDYHHTGGKSANVSSLYEKSRDRLAREIEKCVLLCANCHRDETQRESRGEHVFKNRRTAPPIVDRALTQGCPTKTCRRCGQDKHEDDFSVLRSGARHTYCRKCLREYNSKFSSGRKRATSEYLQEVKDNKPCKDCGRAFRYWVLDFDHVGEKTAGFGKLRGASLEAMKAEVQACDLVCANCHRERTHRLRASLPPARERGPVKLAEFELSQIRVARCSDTRAAKSILERHHYAGFGRPATAVYAAYLQDRVIAVAKLAPVVRVEVATSSGMDPSGVLELDRLCVVPEYQVKNLPSKFLSLMVKAVKKDLPSTSALVSFADPDQGHSGGVYRASNWTGVGTSAPSYEYVAEDGSRVHKKTLYNRARRLGMKEREYADAKGYVRRPLPGRHKFVMVLS